MRLDDPLRPQVMGMPQLTLDGKVLCAVPPIYLKWQPSGWRAGVHTCIAPNRARWHYVDLEARDLTTIHRDFAEDPEAALAHWFAWKWEGDAKAAPTTLTLEDLDL